MYFSNLVTIINCLVTLSSASFIIKAIRKVPEDILQRQVPKPTDGVRAWDLAEIKTELILPSYHIKATLLTFDLDQVAFRAGYSGPSRALERYRDIISYLSQLPGLDVHILSEGEFDGVMDLFPGELSRVTFAGDNGGFIRPKESDQYRFLTGSQSQFKIELKKLGKKLGFKPQIEYTGVSAQFAYKGNPAKIQELAQNYGYILEQGEGKVVLQRKYTKGSYVEKLLQKGNYRSAIAFGDESPDEGIHKAMRKREFLSVVIPWHPDQKSIAQYLAPDDGQLLEILQESVDATMVDPVKESSSELPESPA